MFMCSCVENVNKIKLFDELFVTFFSMEKIIEFPRKGKGLQEKENELEKEKGLGLNLVNNFMDNRDNTISNSGNFVYK
jgi:hypothetical protein